MHFRPAYVFRRRGKSLKCHYTLPPIANETSPCTSTQCWAEWNVTMHFHPALGACPPLKEVPISRALPSSNCPGLRVLQKFNKQRDLFLRPVISTKSDRSHVWWLSEGEGKPAPRWKRTPFWKSHTPLDSWGLRLGLSCHEWGVQNGVRFRRGAGEGGRRYQVVSYLLKSELLTRLTLFATRRSQAGSSNCAARRGWGWSLEWSRYECNFFGPIWPGMKFMHHVAQ